MRTACLIVSCLLTILSRTTAEGQANTTAFVHYNVVPMTGDTVFRDHTVLISGGKITALGPSNSVRVPRGATRIDGRGRQFIVPALADMHTHATNPRDLALYASHGVLTILNMGWSPDAFVALERLRYNSGEAFGPTILEARRMNWPYGRTSGISTVAQGKDTVRFAVKLGYDFIKIYSFLADTVFDAIMEEAADAKIAPIGHQTYGIGLSRSIRSGLKMVAHAEELGPSVGVPLTSAGADSMVRVFQEFGTWLTPTLSTFEAITNVWGNRTRLEQYIAEGIAAHMPASTVEGWRRTNYHNQTGSAQDRLTAYTEITRRLHTAQVPMLAGTDGPGIPGMIPGVAIHDELRTMQAIGMTPFEALATATSNPGRFVTKYVPGAVPFGTVSVGARADLLIVPTNPITDLAVLRTPTAVVRLGRVYSAQQLDSIRIAK